MSLLSKVGINIYSKGMPSNCRNSCGDIGKCCSFGVTSANRTPMHSDKWYKYSSLWHVLPNLCISMTFFLFKVLPTLLWHFIITMRSMGIYPLGILGGAFGPAASVVITWDLANAMHVDPNDHGMSCALWGELEDGDATNW